MKFKYILALFITVCVFLISIHLVFYVVLSTNQKSRLLNVLPEKVVQSYLGFVLADELGPFRNRQDKYDLILAIDHSTNNGKQLNLDYALFTKFAGEVQMSKSYGLQFEEPIEHLATKIILNGGSEDVFSFLEYYNSRIPRRILEICSKVDRGIYRLSNEMSQKFCS